MVTECRHVLKQEWCYRFTPPNGSKRELPVDPFTICTDLLYKPWRECIHWLSASFNDPSHAPLSLTQSIRD